jgi:hypothetical protein
VIGNCHDLETAVGDGVDQLLGRPEAIAGQGMEVKVDGVAGVERIRAIGHVGIILGGCGEYMSL